MQAITLFWSDMILSEDLVNFCTGKVQVDTMEMRVSRTWCNEAVGSGNPHNERPYWTSHQHVAMQHFEFEYMHCW